MVSKAFEPLTPPKLSKKCTFLLKYNLVYDIYIYMTLEEIL